MYYGQSFALQAEVDQLRSELVAYRVEDIPIDKSMHSRRALRRKLRMENREAPVSPQKRKESQPEKIPETAPAEEVMHDCDMRKAIVEELRIVVMDLLPQTASYERVRGRVEDAFMMSAIECEEKEETKEVEINDKKQSSVPVPHVNNKCEQYNKKSQRYTRCLVNEQRGQRYVGRQTRR